MGRVNRVDRRRLLQATTAGLASQGLGLGCAGPSVTADPAGVSFQHGVASGDPFPDSVVLWTRVSGLTDETIRVLFEVAHDPDFSQIISRGEQLTDITCDYTVKVEARDLEPETTYYYRFRAGSKASRIGRTRTAAAGNNARLRFATVACSNHAYGYFSAYRRIAERADLDFVLHLGDYIYEYGVDEYGDVRRPDPPHEILTLHDYRRRYAQYRRDPDLQEAHRQHPFIAIWDDHEVANNSWVSGAQNHDESEGPFQLRKAAALQAYFEWMPIRETEGRRGYRCFSLGELADLMVLDTRLQGRDPPVDIQSAQAEDRTLLGEDQLKWLLDGLETSQAKWLLIGNQVLLGQLVHVYNGDAWDGFPAERRRLLSHIEELELENVVVLTGDIHMSFALELAPDPLDPSAYDPETGKGAVAVEVTAPGVTSPGLTDELGDIAQVVLDEVLHIKYSQLSKRGYILLDLDRSRLLAEFYHFQRVDLPDQAESLAAVFEVRAGTSHLIPVDGPSEPVLDPPALAPKDAGEVSMDMAADKDEAIPSKS